MCKCVCVCARARACVRVCVCVRARVRVRVAAYKSVTHAHTRARPPGHTQVREDWLRALLHDALAGDFWMKGSAMRYPPRFNIG